MFRNLLKRLFYKAYLIGKHEADLKSQVQKEEILRNSATIGNDTIIYPEAIIQNNLGDRSKLKIGNGSRILGHLMLFGHGGEIIVGDYCFIGKGTLIWSALRITIGNRVLISHNVNIHDNISHPLNSKERHADFVQIFTKGFNQVNNLREKEIIIEDDVWIGFNVTIMKGVRINRGAIIGSNTIITKDVPPFAVVVGNPQKIIKYSD